MTCPRCGGADGAHFAYCFAAQLFERLMGPGYPLFPHVERADHEPAAPVTAEFDLLQRNLDQAYARIRELESTPASPSSEVAGDLASILAQVREERERIEALASRLHVVGEDSALPPPRPSEGPWRWNAQHREYEEADAEPTDLQRELAEEEARATEEAQATVDATEAAEVVAAEPVAATVEPAPRYVERPEVAAHIAKIVAEAPPLSAEQVSTVRTLLGVPTRPAEPGQATAEPAPTTEEERERALVEAAERKAWIDEHRALLRQKINAHPRVLSQKKLAVAIGVNDGTVSFILNGKAYGPTSRTHLERMLEAADNLVAAGAPAPEPEPAPAPEPAPPAEEVVAGRPVKDNNGFAVTAEHMAAIELFLAERVETLPGAWEAAPDVRDAYEAWRPKIDAPELSPTTIGQVLVKHGFARERRTMGGKQLRGYGGLRLRPAESTEAEPAPEEPAVPERLHPDAERYTSDGIDALLAGTPPHLITQFVASEGVPPPAFPEPESLLPNNIFDRPVEMPPGWDDLPGKELTDREIRGYATKLVKSQGWGYKRSKGRGKPKLRSPNGDVYTLPLTPSDYRSALNARAELRRLGAVL